MKKLIILIFSAVMLLSACNNRTVDVDLTPEQIEEVNTQIAVLQSEIDTLKSEDKEVNHLTYVKLARAYKTLGKLGDAIDLYESLLNDGVVTRVFIHNLGRLYEKVGEYDLAVEQYERIIDEYFDQNYLYDITWAYIRKGDVKEAEKHFNAWQLEFQKTDGQTQNAIKKLKESQG